MENPHVDELRAELNLLLKKQVQVLEFRSLGAATDTELLRIRGQARDRSRIM